MEKRLLTSAEVFDETVHVGIKKSKNNPLQTLILSILAGGFIAIGGYASGMASHSIENIGLSKLAAGVVFPVGLIFVLICGAELFTGNTLLAVAAAERRISFKQMIKNWIIVFFGNMLGAFIIAFLVFSSGLLDTNSGALGGYAIKVAATKSSLEFTQALASGILCNFMVCLSVWGSYAAKDAIGKIFMAFFPIMAFVVAGFEHSVANMYYFSIGLMAKTNNVYISASHVAQEKLEKLDILHVVGSLIPVTIGNIIGGAVMVGLAYWAVYRYIPSLKRKNERSVVLIKENHG